MGAGCSSLAQNTQEDTATADCKHLQVAVATSNQISILASQTGLLAVWYPYSDPTRLDFIVISYGFEASVTEFLAMRLSTAAFIALAVRTAGLRVILDTDLGDDIDDTWALSALLQAQQREEGCYCCS